MVEKIELKNSKQKLLFLQVVLLTQNFKINMKTMHKMHKNLNEIKVSLSDSN